MNLAIFAKTFSRPDLAATLAAVAAHGLSRVQFNFACCGLPTLPPRIEPALLADLRRELQAHRIEIVAISGTFNLIHPDTAQRRAGLERLPILAAAARELDAPLITLCTGTRDPADMWRAHPDNATAAAWRDLRASLEEALTLTAPWDITLGIEPETANVVDSARAARRLLDEVRSPRLKIVMDPANLLRPGDLPRQHVILDEAFDLLGADVALAHAKELGPDLHPDNRGPGRGVVDWAYYVIRLRGAAFDGALVLHGLAEAEVPGAVEFLRQLSE